MNRIKNQNTGFHGEATTTALSKETEQLLVHMLKCFGDWGYGLTFRNKQSIVEDYLNQTNQTAIFKNNKPGKDWWYSFLNRWKSDVSIRKADNIASLRAASCTDDVINRYFENCKKQFDEANIDDSKSSHI
jgi:hypothetical protein